MSADRQSRVLTHVQALRNLLPSHLWLAMLDACRQGRWNDLRVYAGGVKLEYAHDRSVRCECDCILIYLA